MKAFFNQFRKLFMKPAMYTKKQLITELKALLKTAEREPAKLTSGICHSIQGMMKRNYNALLHGDEVGAGKINLVSFLCRRIFVGWIGHTNQTLFPIREDYDLGRWEGTNLEQRISLIKYSINKLENMSDYDFERNLEWNP